MALVRESYEKWHIGTTTGLLFKFYLNGNSTTMIFIENQYQKSIFIEIE